MATAAGGRRRGARRARRVVVDTNNGVWDGGVDFAPIGGKKRRNLNSKHITVSVFGVVGNLYRCRRHGGSPVRFGATSGHQNQNTRICDEGDGTETMNYLLKQA